MDSILGHPTGIQQDAMVDGISPHADGINSEGRIRPRIHYPGSSSSSVATWLHLISGSTVPLSLSLRLHSAHFSQRVCRKVFQNQLRYEASSVWRQHSLHPHIRTHRRFSGSFQEQPGCSKSLHHH